MDLLALSRKIIKNVISFVQFASINVFKMPPAEIGLERKLGEGIRNGFQVSASVGNNFIKINFGCPACGQLKGD